MITAQLSILALLWFAYGALHSCWPLWITLYFVLGSRLEESKLIVYYGDIYRRYRERVPALLPLPWRYLSQQEAAALLASATQSRSHSHDVASTPPP
jgi:hypothetical protein